MKVVFTGGGTGGHFYPVIAVAEELLSLARERKFLEPRLFYFAPDPYDKRLLFEHGIEFRAVPAGKVRRYASPANALDIVKTAVGSAIALGKLFAVYPDVVMSKGGYGSVPTVLAARLLRIPIVVHESDAVPGRANRWAARAAAVIGVSYPDAATQFPKGSNVALVGNPIRREIAEPAREGAHQFLGLDRTVPTILILGGSQGAERLNDVILQALPDLVSRYQVIHQTGRAHLDEVRSASRVALSDNPFARRYLPFDYLSALALRMAAGAADLVISRGGSGAIFEIASWGIPAILVPIPEDVSHDQRKNAFAYARSGAAVVMEERNLAPHLLVAEVNRLMGDEKARAAMTAAARNFARPDAARKIAEAILAIALSHESS